MKPEQKHDLIDHLDGVLRSELWSLSKKKDEITHALDILRNLEKGPSEFRCMRGDSNYDAICSSCSLVLPRVVEGYVGGGKRIISLEVPELMSDHTLKLQVLGNRVGCSQWQKKEWESSCGCGGEARCVCGFVSRYCSPQLMGLDGKCSYCGRELKYISSGMADGLFRIELNNNGKETI